MDEPQGPRRTGAGSSPRSGPPAAPRREVRVDRRALAAVLAAGALIVASVAGLGAWRSHAGRSALLREAIRQRDELGRPDLALGYFNRYLELAPDDLEAADGRASLLAGAARDPGSIEAAIRAHVQLLARERTGAAARPGARERLAGLYLRSMQFRAAEQASRDALRLGAGVGARRLLARALEGSGRLGDAGALAASVVEYEAAEAAEPGDVASGERLATLYLDKFADRPRALKVLGALLEHHPGSTEARLARSRFFASSGDARAAADEVDEAIRLDPADAEVRIAAADAAARRDDPAAARAHLGAIRPPRAVDIRVKIIEGQIALDERDADGAIDRWRAALALGGGTDLDLTWRLAHVLLQLGRTGEAAPLLSQYRRLSGGDEPTPAGRFLAGLLALKEGRTARAIVELEAIRYKVDRGLEGQLYLTLGRAYEASMEPSKAADAYQRAAASGGAGPAPWLALAGLHAAGRPEEEAAILERGVAAIGPDERLMAGLARSLWRREAARPARDRDWSWLEDVLRRAEEVAPRSVDLALVRADYASSAGRPEDGLAALEAAIGRDPASAPLRMAQVEALARLGRLVEAADAIDRAVASAGDRAGFRVARSRLGLRKGEVKAARAALVDAPDRVPAGDRAELSRAEGEFHRSQGDRAAAARAFRDWSSAQPGAIEPHLALLGLAAEADDGPGVDAEVEALRAIVGPSSVPWKIARAEALLRDRRGSPPTPAMLDEAARLVDEIAASAPRRPAGALLGARLMERRGDPDGAIGAYERALGLEAGPAAVRPLVSLLAGLGRVDALEALRSRLGGFAPEVERLAGAAAIRRGKPEEAEEMARRLVEGDPSGLDARAWQARVLGAMGKPEEAERALLSLVEARPEAPAPWIQLLMSQIARKDPAAARATIERMKGRVKADRPDLLRALCCRAANLADEADRAFDDALRAFPDEVPTIQSAVDHYEATGRPDRAGPLLRRAHRLYPGLDWARRRLALNLAGRPGDRASWEEALGLVGGASEAADTPDDRLARAVVLSLGPEGRRAEAVAILDALAAEVPESGKVQEALARALLATGQAPRARDHAARAARGADASPGSIRLIAALDLAAKDPDAALRQLARLGAIGPDGPATLELRARALKAQGKAAEAVGLVESAFGAAEGSPGAVGLGRALVRLLAMMDEPGAAEGLARRVARLGPSGSVLLAEWLGSRGRFEEASAAFESATSADGPARKEAARSALAMASMGRDPRWLGLADRLIDRAEAGSGLGAPDPDLARDRATLRHLQGRPEEAVRIFDELAARSPADLLVLNNAAWILSEELGRPLEGLTRVDALIAGSGPQPHSLDTRGVIRLRLGRVAPAIEDLEAASSAVPSATICFHLARAYLAAGRGPDAAGALRKATAAGLRPESLGPSERADFDRIRSAPGVDQH